MDNGWLIIDPWLYLEMVSELQCAYDAIAICFSWFKLNRKHGMYWDYLFKYEIIYKKYENVVNKNI